MKKAEMCIIIYRVLQKKNRYFCWNGIKMIFILKFGIFVLQAFYQCMKLLPVKNKIVMISRQSNEPSVDFCLLGSALQSGNEKIEVVYLCKTLDGGADAGFGSKCAYLLHMFKQMYHMATAKVVLLDTYCIAASVLHHRKSLKIIQMWHSMGTMKLFGYTAVGTEEGRTGKVAECMHMHANYDYFIAASDNYKAHLAAGFGCDEGKAFICPLPRYDLLKSAEYKARKQAEIYEKYPELRAKKKILYCPTFRADEHQMKQAVQGLVNSLPDGYELIVKLHPLSETDIESAHVWKLNEYSTFDALFIADYVISDYSCVVYEAGILKLPLCFYVFDYDRYAEKRGLAISLKEEAAGVISEDPAVIMKAIETDAFDMQAIEGFIGKYISKTESATVRLADFIIRVGGLDV